MNNRESKKMMGTCKTLEKMKRIALVILSTIALASCGDKPVDPIPPVVPERPGPSGSGKEVTLSVIVPKNSVSTYANEDANTAENYIDSLYIYLYQGATLLSDKGFKRRPPSTDDITVVDDSTLLIKYEVDNIAGPTGLRVEVFANRRAPEVLTGEILFPNLIADPPQNLFFMSGKATLGTNTQGSGYAGKVSLQRNVAKLRVNISKNSVVIPDDLEIDYPTVKVQVTTTPTNTTPFYDDSPLNFANMSYPARPLRPINNNINTFAGGQIDSVYLYENRRTNYGTNDVTQVTITIPTLSASEGNKTVTKTYTIRTKTADLDVLHVLRNYIYTLDIKVQGQGLDPLVTLDLERWNDVNIDAGIVGTYLTTDVSEILFDANGKATINFCTDAQAIYFDFATFNNNNDRNLGFGNVSIKPVGIDNTDLALSPTGFKGGQILLDQRHCGSFGFQLELDSFPAWPNVNFSGSICIKAGNIVKCFTFPAKHLYDAHFIVGEPLLNGELFTSASTTGGLWIEVSNNRLYTTNAGTSISISSGAAPIYLHLDENLTTSKRSGSITLRNGSLEKIVHITQLPAIPVGLFSYNSSAIDFPEFNAGLFTEQIHEYTTLVQYANAAFPTVQTPVSNYIYNGIKAAQTQVGAGGVLDFNNYKNSPYFNYQAAAYSAANYCLYKNRHSPKTTNGDLVEADIKWYLPTQAQLMGMWLTYESYKEAPDATFYPNSQSQAYWSVTGNFDYKDEAQYVNFAFGNVGHTKMYMPGTGNRRYWARCVRNDDTKPNASLVNGNSPTLNFSTTNGMPSASYSSSSKGNASGDENSTNNQTLYQNLRVAMQDATANSVKWNIGLCSTYTESGVTGQWRLPTQRELQAIWLMQSELDRKHSNFTLLGNDYYWSATHAFQAPTNYWVVYGSVNYPGGSGNTPHRHGDELSRVRCVHE